MDDDIISQATAILQAEADRLMAAGGIAPKRRSTDWKNDTKEGLRRHPLRRRTEGPWDPPPV